MTDDWQAALRRIKKLMSGGRKAAPAGGIDVAKSVLPDVVRVECDTKGVRPQSTSGGEVFAPVATLPQILPREPQAGRGPTFNIGIDLGTSTTKVCFRPPGEIVSIQIVNLYGAQQANSALSPSTLTVDNQKVYFGLEAEERARHPGSQVFRQLKVCVACEVRARPQVPSSTCQADRSVPSGQCSARFRIDGGQAQAHISASDLMTLLLAWTMGESRRRLPAAMTGGALPRTTYSVSAPIDQIDAGSALNDVYGPLVFNAWRLSGAVRQGLALSEALQWFRSLRDSGSPPGNERLVELCPESSASMVGFALSPEIREGLYGVVDIGAWTTEISFFRYSEVGKQITAKATRAFYAAQSHRVAMNEVDERCRNHVLQMYDKASDDSPWLVDQIRCQRECGVFGDGTLPLRVLHGDVTPRKSSLSYAKDLVAEELRRCFVEILGKAYEKEKKHSIWEGTLRVMFAGGGALDETLRSGIEHPFIVGSELVPPPGDLEALPRKDDYCRFLVAYGLAHGSARWPRDFLPSETLPLEPKRKHRLTWEELGYDNP